VSHDLRSPLTRIAGFSQALQESYAHQLDDAGRLHLERVNTAARRMSQLVDDLLNFSRVTRLELRQETVNLSALARSIAEELESRDPMRKAAFAITDGLLAVGDQGLLRSTLLNLLENAWKFTRKRMDPCIEFGGRIENGTMVFYVRDNGAGFDPELTHKLFSPFQRLYPSSSRRIRLGWPLPTDYPAARRPCIWRRAKSISDIFTCSRGIDAIRWSWPGNET
jgi:signal transduction histidine kinase